MPGQGDPAPGAGRDSVPGGDRLLARVPVPPSPLTRCCPHARYNLLFFASGGGKFNYQGTKRWLEDNLDHTGERLPGELGRRGAGVLAPRPSQPSLPPRRLQSAAGQRGLRAVPGHRGPRRQPALARVQAAAGGDAAARLPAGAGGGRCLPARSLAQGRRGIQGLEGRGGSARGSAAAGSQGRVSIGERSWGGAMGPSAPPP